MKKLMMLVCVLGLSAVVHAQILSPGLTSYSDLLEKSEDKKVDAKVQAKKINHELENANNQARQEYNEKQPLVIPAKIAEVQQLEAFALAGIISSKLKSPEEFIERKMYVAARLKALDNTSFSVQAALFALEDFASYVKNLEMDEKTLADLEKGLLVMSAYYIPYFSKEKGYTLKEAAVIVNKEALRHGHNISTAGLNKEAAAFYGI